MIPSARPNRLDHTMTIDQKTKASCPKCHTEMLYVTAMSHPMAPQMQRTTFVCRGCNQTRNYMLSAKMADAYASDCAHAAVPV